MAGTRDRDNFDRVRCSFCGKQRSEVRKLIAGPNVYICNECVELCREIVQLTCWYCGSSPLQEVQPS